MDAEHTDPAHEAREGEHVDEASTEEEDPFAFQEEDRCKRDDERMDFIVSELMRTLRSLTSTEVEEKLQLISEVTDPANSSHSLQVKATMKVRGTNVVDAEILLVKPHGSLTKTTIREDRPYYLMQIKDCCSMLQILLQDIHSHRHVRKPGMISYTQEFLYHVFNGLREAGYVLDSPPKRSIEEHVANNKMRKFFSPDLPENAVISIYVKQSRLTLAWYTLPAAGASSSSHKQQSTDKLIRCIASQSLPRVINAMEVFQNMALQVGMLLQSYEVNVEIERIAKLQI